MRLSQTCRHCGRDFSSDEDRCPHCGRYPVAGARDGEASESFPGDEPDATEVCSYCGKMIAEGAAQCPYCGEYADGGGRKAPGSLPRVYLLAALLAILALLLPALAGLFWWLTPG